MWPWPFWQPPRLRPWGWRKVLVAVTLHWPRFSHMAVPICLWGWRERPSFQTAMCSWNPGFVTREEWEQILRIVSSLCHTFIVLGVWQWRWSQLFTQFLYHCSFFPWVINIFIICRARESFLVYVYVSFEVVCRTWFYSAKSHWMSAKWK